VRQHLRVVSAEYENRIAKRRGQAKTSLGFGIATFLLAAVGFLVSALVAPLAALTAGAALVHGVLGLRAPRTKASTVSAATGIALAVLPIVPVLFIAYLFATGGIE
jgi:hypothetical protein